MRRVLSRGLVALLGLALVGSMLFAADRNPGDLANTADVSQFNPGNLMSDAVFFDENAMGLGAIASFISAKGASCTAGSDGTPCLKDFTQDTVARSADAYCSGYAAGSDEPAAVIIAKVAGACGINPEVLLVLIQKEQGLVLATSSTLRASRYQKATGYACPDTAACDSTYNGFQNQLYSAARQFERYAAAPGSFGYRAGRTSNVLWSPDSSCGSSPVYIQNQATSGLYNYTPYQPNAAALAAGYGTGNGCSSYGNRNFWLYFTDWFGSSQLPGQTAWQPIGHIDSAIAVRGDQMRIQGWTVDPDTTGPILVHAYVDGVFQSAYWANVERPDLAAAMPAMGTAHGFDLPLTTTPGPHTVCVYAINVGAAASNALLGCPAVDTGPMPFGNVDSVVVTGSQGRVRGWAVDLDSAAPTAVHVYVNGAMVATGVTGQSRPDVAAAYPAAGSTRGFDVPAQLAAGDNQVCAYAINVPAPADNPLLGCRTAHLDVTPYGHVDSVVAKNRAVRVSGWAVDPETSDPLDVHVLVDGADVGTLRADASRPDIAAAFPWAGDLHGIDGDVPVVPGVHQVCVVAMNLGLGSTNPQLGCSTVNVGAPPVGRFDSVTVTGFQARVAGWALDPDTSDPVQVRLTLDGKQVGTTTASADRPDIAAAFPGAGAAHGIDATLTVPSGQHTVCGTAVNTLGGTGDPVVSCAVVTVWGGAHAPIGRVDGITRINGITTVAGWALDPDGPDSPSQVQFVVDGSYGNSVTADGSRPDVGAYYPGVGDAHGYAGYWILPPGTHTICAYGVNKGAGTSSTLLGCGRISIP